MKTFWNKIDRTAIAERLRKLKPEVRPVWGKLTAEQIVCHLSDQLRIAYGEIQSEDARGASRFWPLNILIIHFLPWPQGAPSPKEAWTTSPATWQKDILALEQLVEKFNTKARYGNWPHHSMFGKMTGTSWGRLSYRHFDHHLRQLGV